MERVTHIDKDGWYINGANVATVFHSGTGEIRMRGKDIDRLAAYEDGEVFGLKVDKQELNQYRALGSIDRLRELKQADDEGRCVVLPCKAGETVYLITAPGNVSGIDLEDLTDEECEHNRIFECKVSSMTIWDNGAHIQVRLHFNGQFVAHYITPEDFGKVVFLSCADAEAALRREQDG